MTREEALVFVQEKIKNENLRRHCYAVEAVMRALASYFQADQAKWGLAGLLHDVDYEFTKNNPADHIKQALLWLKKKKIDPEVLRAIQAHGWGFVVDSPMPRNKLEWSLYCCDELTGLIVAVALVKGKKLNNVTVESVLKKFPQKSFASGVSREQIKLCWEKLGINLSDFIGLALQAMQNIHKELGL